MAIPQDQPMQPSMGVYPGQPQPQNNPNAQMAPPSIDDLIGRMENTDRQYRQVLQERNNWRKAIVNLHAPFKVGDEVLITLRKNNRQEVATITRIVWDSLTRDFAYMFKIRRKYGKKAHIPSGHVTDIVGL